MRMDVAERAARAQVAFAVAEQVRAGIGQRQAVADRGHRVLQHALPAHGHVHVARGHGRQLQIEGQREQAIEACGIVVVAVQFDGQMRTLAEGGAQPGAFVRIRRRARQPQSEQASRARVERLRFDIATRHAILALDAGPSRDRDQPAQLRVAGQVLDQQDQPQAVVELEFGADDELDAGDLRRLVRTHDARQRTLVGDRQRLVAAARGALEQLLGAGSAAQEREVRQAVQLGIRGDAVIVRARVRCSIAVANDAQATLHAHAARDMRTRRVAIDARREIVLIAHANHPCSIQPSRSPAGVNAQARCPRAVSTT